MLNAISPLDGRYTEKTKELQHYFSEHALFKYRIQVEIEYFIALCESNIFPNSLNENDKHNLRKLYTAFSLEDAECIKAIEKTTNHDIKAVEYYIKDQIKHEPFASLKEFVHFGLTSQDINNTAIPLSLKDFCHQVFYPQIRQLNLKIIELSKELKNIPMLARTHGQAASPTTLGKEIAVFAERLQIQSNDLENIIFSGKFGGATGNFNAHKVAYPDVNWPEWANNFYTEKFNLVRQQTTTQIAHYDELAKWFHCLSRINTILIDMCRDIWMYISMDYFKQKTKAGEIGSSAMPHKVNPIDFENAEGNFMYANAISIFLAEKLPISRLQRDLTDSTVLRNIGTPIGHTLLAIKSLKSGLEKIVVNPDKIQQELNQNWMILAEAIQTILRRENYPNPYEALKDLTRGKSGITEKDLSVFIEALDIEEKTKIELRNLSPANYIGYAAE